MMMMTGGMIVVVAAAVALAEGDHHPAVLRTKDYEDEVQTLRRQYETKITTLRKLHDLLQQRHEHTTANTPAAASVMNMIRSDVEYNTAKYNELVQRTYRVRTNVQDYNYNALQSKQQQEGGGGLASRLSDILHQEMTRRDRYHTSINNTNSTRNAGKNNTNNRYVTQAELATLLTPSSHLFANMSSSRGAMNMTSSDAIITQVIKTYTQKEDATLQSRLQYITTKYPYEYNTTITMYKNALAEKKKEKQVTKCITIPKGIQLVTNELSNDGGTGDASLVDYAKLGRVVYEMTSLPYIPPPPLYSPSSSINNKNGEYGDDDDDEYDTLIENAYWQQQQQDNNSENSGILYQLRNLQYDEVYNILYKYTTKYNFNTILRPYLPDDWERLLDYYLPSSPSWSENTIYSTLSNIIPDYMFHAWDVPYAKTAHPTVVIGSSNSNNIVGMESEEGESRRRKTSPMGQCYPLSMSTTSDGMDDLLSTFAPPHHHHGEMNDNDDDEDDANKLGLSFGRPRYTIDLPYPIYIDAVTLEHRSFPINQQHGEDNVGGDSAPRYVRVVGYPPCPGLDDNGRMNEEGSGYGGGSSSSRIAQSCELSQYGFDISSPINLGLLEYQRITTVVTDEKNGRRYKTKTTTTNTKKNEELLSSSFLEGGRYRSIQTFAVKGGLWKPQLLEEDVFSSFTVNDDIATQVKNKENLVEIMLDVVDDDDDDNPEFVSPGQCTPPKDEDSVPSCGENINDTMKESGRSSSSNRRRIVKAVSFIVEENWGNADYTCLYRVRVHGDKVV
jgi:hypothetical protein